MHPEILLEQRAAVSALSLVAALIYGVAGARASGCAEQSAAARYAVAAVALVIAALGSVGPISPAILYGVLCLMLVSVYGADVLKQERARRRRVASLALRPVADAVPTFWIGTAAASSFMLTPYVVLDQQRIAALLVGFCALATAAIAWRVATAPVQLAGKDVASERVHDRTMRCMRSGIASVLAVGSIMVFISFENSELRSVLPLQRALHFASLGLWVTFAIWVVAVCIWAAWHVRRFETTSFPTAP